MESRYSDKDVRLLDQIFQALIREYEICDKRAKIRNKVVKKYGEITGKRISPFQKTHFYLAHDETHLGPTPATLLISKIARILASRPNDAEFEQAIGCLWDLHLLLQEFQQLLETIDTREHEQAIEYLGELYSLPQNGHELLTYTDTDDTDFAGWDENEPEDKYKTHSPQVLFEFLTESYPLTEIQLAVEKEPINNPIIEDEKIKRTSSLPKTIKQGIFGRSISEPHSKNNNSPRNNNNSPRNHNHSPRNNNSPRYNNSQPSSLSESPRMSDTLAIPIAGNSPPIKPRAGSFGSSVSGSSPTEHQKRRGSFSFLGKKPKEKEGVDENSEHLPNKNNNNNNKK